MPSAGDAEPPSIPQRSPGVRQLSPALHGVQHHLRSLLHAKKEPLERRTRNERLAQSLNSKRDELKDVSSKTTPRQSATRALPRAHPRPPHPKTHAPSWTGSDIAFLNNHHLALSQPGFGASNAPRFRHLNPPSPRPLSLPRPAPRRLARPRSPKIMDVSSGSGAGAPPPASCAAPGPTASGPPTATTRRAYRAS